MSVTPWSEIEVKVKQGISEITRGRLEKRKRRVENTREERTENRKREWEWERNEQRDIEWERERERSSWENREKGLGDKHYS